MSLLDESLAISSELGMRPQALDSGNIEALLALYEPEASFNPEPGEEIHGKEAIRQALEGFLAMKPNITLDTKTLAQTAEVALCTAKWHLSSLCQGLGIQVGDIKGVTRWLSLRFSTPSEFTEVKVCQL